MFALPDSDGAGISLIDCFRVVPEGVLQTKEIGVWTYPYFLEKEPSQEKSSKYDKDAIIRRNMNLLKTDNLNIWKIRQNLSGLVIRCSVIEVCRNFGYFNRMFMVIFFSRGIL